MRYRNRVLALLSLLTVITYLDRVCISVAGPRIQESLHLTPAQWGWVTGIFTLSYGAFEIPTGLLGDRIGARRVLTRVVLWWSAFTTFTGMVGGYYSMLVTRFFFGAGEAGAYPNISVVIARWVPVEERGRAFGFLLAAAQVGGAIAPLLVVPIQIHYGWRASFYVFGIVGVAWALLWYSRYRDSPAEMSGVSAAEIAETKGLVTSTRHMLPWGLALRSINFWRIPIICFCYIYTNVFFLTWFHTYLVKARGFSEKQLLLSSLPFFVAACANLAGGLASHLLVKRVGLRWGRCSLGVIGLGVAGLSMIAVVFTHSPYVALALLCVVNGGITFQQPIAFAVCLDIGGAYSGAIRRSVEHGRRGCRVLVFTGVRIHRWPYRQLQPALRPNGRAAVHRRVYMAQVRPHPAAHPRRNRLPRLSPPRNPLTGATALHFGFDVATLNVKHFERLPGLKVVSI